MLRNHALKVALAAATLAAAPVTVLGQARSGALDSVEVILSEAPARAGAVFLLELRTVEALPCFGARIQSTFARRGDTLALNLTGIQQPSGCIPQAEVAKAAHTFQLTPGTYTLAIRSGARADRIRLEVTPTLARMVPVRRSFTRPDPRDSYRVPANSFRVTCGDARRAKAVCDDIFGWVARQPGVTRYPIPANAINPYMVMKSGARPDMEVQLFRSTSPEAVARVGRCMGLLGVQIREIRAFTADVLTWRGELFTASSRRQFDEPETPLPTGVTERAGCDR